MVGASAGGVEALRAVAHGLPGDLDAAVLVVLHVAPAAPSALAKILARAGALVAVTARHGDRIVHGRMFVAPPDHHMMVRDGTIVLSRGPTENGHRPAIDPLFRSAAAQFGNRVVGVVLSGSGDDGTAGLAAIVERGGVSVVQDPDTALHRAMPSAAIAHLTIDHVLPPTEIGELLGALAAQEACGGAQPPHNVTAPTAPGTVDLFDSSVRTSATELSCPFCQGAMVELNSVPSPRYQCRVGHVWSPESLVAAQGESMDTALWSALRALEERAALSRQLAALGVSRGQDVVDRHTERAVDAERVAEQIRQLLRDISYGESSCR